MVVKSWRKKIKKDAVQISGLLWSAHEQTVLSVCFNNYPWKRKHSDILLHRLIVNGLLLLLIMQIRSLLRGCIVSLNMGKTERGSN